MKFYFTRIFLLLIVSFCFLCPQVAFNQVIISQYYEGTGTNKWIELTNTGNNPINTASPQLKLAIWVVNGTTGNISIKNQASAIYNLTVTIPAKGSILIGNSSNGTEVPYLTAASANEISNTVINFNGNDGVALLDATNKIIDRFGDGINAVDISYVRKTTVTLPRSTFLLSEWTSTTLANVQLAAPNVANRLGYQFQPLCVVPVAQPTSFVFSGVTSNSINTSFTAASGADGYVVIRSTSSTLSALPVDGSIYTVGNALGGGTVVSSGASTTFTNTGLASNTIYYFYAFSYKNTNCTGGPKYLTATPLTANQSTTLPACVAPAAQPTSFVFSGETSNSINTSFTAASGADGYVVVRSTSSTLTSLPAEATTYTVGNALGGGVIESVGANTSFSSTGLNANTTYYYFAFAYNNSSCLGGPVYLTTNPLTAYQSTSVPPCVSPAAQPTSFVFSGVTSNSINTSFTAVSGADGYVVIRSTISTLSGLPADGSSYNVGNSLGGGVIESVGANTSFSSTGLNANTTYYYFAFAYNNSNCQGGPVYLTTNPLEAYQSTSVPPCVAPAAQSTSFVFSGVTSNSINTSFTAASGADGYVVVRSTSSTLSALPTDGSSYTVGDALGGGLIESVGANTSFSSTGLNANTTYYYFAFAYNNSNCQGGPVYLNTNPLEANQFTTLPACIAPSNNASTMIFSAVTSNSLTVSFTTAGGIDGYLVIRSTINTLSSNPLNGMAYTSGSSLGGGVVISSGNSSLIPQSGLISSTTYYYYIFSYNNTNCSGAPAYNQAPLTGSRTTESTVLSYYFGNLHSHSSYSDGNSDDPTKTPAHDYEFAKTALCMDFLGISEHNHALAGMQLSNWQPGITQANAATTSNFVALHGQEWGVIGNQGATGDKAGHVLVYGIDSLIGWETGNYQINVAKSNYIQSGGLFEIINRHGNNAFVTLAHPDNYDFDDLLHIAYNVGADNAIVGSAVESGPAFSTDTTYTNPSTLSTFAFYRNMLAKGYHLGPTVDHDNHNFTFGKTAKSRLAIMTTSLSENNIFDAMRKMRFYATEDCNARIGFTINSNIAMGSIVTKPWAPVINVSTISTTNPVTSIKIMWGVPGSGTAATTLTSTTASSLTYTHTALANLATGYYFLDITESNGARIITSPIWYTRDDASSRPAFVTSFFTINESEKVILKWTASNEPVNEKYEIQRTVDGKSFTTIGELTSKSRQGVSTYTIEDMAPVKGLAFYRLVSKSINGTHAYTELKPVDRSVNGEAYFVVYPNPVRSILTVKFNGTESQSARLDLSDMTGRIIKVQTIQLSKAEQTIQIDVSKFATGNYVVRLQTGKTVQTQMIHKL